MEEQLNEWIREVEAKYNVDVRRDDIDAGSLSAWEIAWSQGSTAMDDYIRLCIDMTASRRANESATETAKARRYLEMVRR
jgi:hypothetical protein